MPPGERNRVQQDQKIIPEVQSRCRRLAPPPRRGDRLRRSGSGGGPLLSSAACFAAAARFNVLVRSGGFAIGEHPLRGSGGDSLDLLMPIAIGGEGADP